jgi:hypothetical protein
MIDEWIIEYYCWFDRIYEDEPLNINNNHVKKENQFNNKITHETELFYKYPKLLTKSKTTLIFELIWNLFNLDVTNYTNKNLSNFKFWY